MICKDNEAQSKSIEYASLLLFVKDGVKVLRLSTLLYTPLFHAAKDCVVYARADSVKLNVFSRVTVLKWWEKFLKAPCVA